jgi:Fur family transcriptional regulator, zinc uptake regulator
MAHMHPSSAKHHKLSPHCRKVIALLSGSSKPLSAYEILDKLRPEGIKAPPTVYRALEALIERGLVHRIESLNAFVACHDDDDHDHHNHSAQFAVCRSCGSVTELHDQRITELLSELSNKLHFHVEREMLELLGQCQQCDSAGA